MEKTFTVVRRAIREAGLLTQVVLVENHIDYEIIIRFCSKRNSPKNVPNCDVSIHRPKTEPVLELDNESYDSLVEEEEEQQDLDQADSTFQETLDLDEAMTIGSSFDATCAKLEEKKIKAVPPKTSKNEFHHNVMTCEPENDIDKCFSEDPNIFDPIEETDPSLSKSKKEADLPRNKKYQHSGPVSDSRQRSHLTVQKGPRPTLPYLHCQHCAFRHKSAVMLERHVKSKHSKEKPFKCPLCKYKTGVEYFLTIHMKMHPGMLPFQCDICSLGCKSAGERNRHKEVCHKKPKTWNCQSCG